MQPDNKPKKVVVETYANDMADVLQDNSEGLVRKIIDEEERKQEEKRDPIARKNNLLAITSLALFAIGLALFAFIFQSRGPRTVEIGQEINPIIFTDRTSLIKIDGLKKSEIITSILNESQSGQVKLGGLAGVYLFEKERGIGLRRFLNILESSLALPENPVLVSDSFMLGRVKIDPEVGSGMFLLMQSRAQVDIFESVRNWERKMLYDLAALFEIDIMGDNAKLLAKNFEDSIVENKNARILYDNDKNPILLYVFADNNNVIFAESREAAKEAMLRLQSKKTKE